MTDCTCPVCKKHIGYSYLSRKFWNVVSDSFNGSYFDTDCPYCGHSISIEVTSIPEFGIIPSLQPSRPKTKS